MRIQRPSFGDLLSQVLTHPFDDAVYTERDPARWLPSIDVPTLACVSSQDDMVGSRGAEGAGKSSASGSIYSLVIAI